jgi:amidohydrolase
VDYDGHLTARSSTGAKLLCRTLETNMTLHSQPDSLLRPDSRLVDWMLHIRRQIHQYPELAYKELQTREFICKKLQELKIPYQTGFAQTGIVATIAPSPATGRMDAIPCVALRADMDALPVQEKTGLPFASQVSGLMHACGHDGHVAMLLGAAALLRQVELPGRVVLLFQPAEEYGNGALDMIGDGALAGVKTIFTGHIDRHFEVGQIAVEPGLICAFTDPFEIHISGRGGHASRPHETVDSIVVASLLVMSIQTLVSREVNPSYPSVISVGRIQGGTASNVIAEEAVLEGTIRTTHAKVRDQIIQGLTRMVRSMDQLYNAHTSIRFLDGLPPVINDAGAAMLARAAAESVVGVDGVVKQNHPSLGGEDFAHYLRKVPGCLVRFGAGLSDHADVPAHSPYFDFDEGVLPIGAAYLAQVARLTLRRTAAPIHQA